MESTQKSTLRLVALILAQMGYILTSVLKGICHGMGSPEVATAIVIAAGSLVGLGRYLWEIL